MHVSEAKRRLGTSVPWLADTMENLFHDAMGRTPNSEIVVDRDGILVARRGWSDPAALRMDMERLVGAVAHATSVTDLDLPQQPAVPTVAKGIVPRVPLPEGAQPMAIEPQLNNSGIPFYAKLRAEGTPELFNTGKGTMYIVEIDAGEPNQTIDLRVQYFACDDELTFCIPVRQDYRVHLTQDEHHHWSIRTAPDGSRLPGSGMGAPPGG